MGAHAPTVYVAAALIERLGADKQLRTSSLDDDLFNFPEALREIVAAAGVGLASSLAAALRSAKALPTTLFLLAAVSGYCPRCGFPLATTAATPRCSMAVCSSTTSSLGLLTRLRLWLRVPRRLRYGRVNVLAGSTSDTDLHSADLRDAAVALEIAAGGTADAGDDPLDEAASESEIIQVAGSADHASGGSGVCGYDCDAIVQWPLPPPPYSPRICPTSPLTVPAPPFDAGTEIDVNEAEREALATRALERFDNVSFKPEESESDEFLLLDLSAEQQDNDWNSDTASRQHGPGADGELLGASGAPRQHGPGADVGLSGASELCRLPCVSLSCRLRECTRGRRYTVWLRTMVAQMPQQVDNTELEEAEREATDTLASERFDNNSFMSEGPEHKAWMATWV